MPLSPTLIIFISFHCFRHIFSSIFFDIIFITAIDASQLSSQTPPPLADAAIEY
jgi:hypothetical protein